MKDDVTRLQGREQVLEGEKAEGQNELETLQAEGVVLLRQVTDLTGQKAELAQQLKVVDGTAIGLEGRITELTIVVELFKERARKAREEQSQQQKVSNTVSCFAEPLTIALVW